MAKEIILATGNKGKLAEIREILCGMPCLVTCLGDYWNPLPHIPEESDTFLGNAAGKAEWVFSRTGKMSLADDSGLEVEFLGGHPGVRSARFAGEPVSDKKNIDKLLSLLSPCPIEKRGAQFRCVVVLKVSPSEEISAEGVCKGRIGLSARGTFGFGYDPVFYPDGYDVSFAELDTGIKNSISHRGKAINALKEKIHERQLFKDR
jgi:non-canonical purine NTP pyrophosphatase (RdgB/HAM1 family)